MSEPACRERIDSLKRLLEIAPWDLNARARLAEGLETAGNLKGALEVWQEVLARDANHLGAWRAMHRIRQRLDEAVP